MKSLLLVFAGTTLLRGTVARDVCSPGLPEEGGCSVSGDDCTGETVTLNPYQLNVSRWNAAMGKSEFVSEITSYAILGAKDTWQMYLHGPHIREKEREDDLAPPPIYVFATFTNQIYRFENFSRPVPKGQKPQPITATQKLVGHADAPSTGYFIDSEAGGRPEGVLIAEGQPFFIFNAPQAYFGGVQYLHRGHKKNCTLVFPLDDHKSIGRVVNTIDCHKNLNICFFSVWVFYDDQSPIWNPVVEKKANDCLYYCTMEKDNITGDPVCKTNGIVKYENGTEICHQPGIGAVHGFTIGNTDKVDPSQFDLLLVFTGKATLDDGESSMAKVTVQVYDRETDAGGKITKIKDLKTLKSKPFAVDLFTKYGHGLDVGGDHAWVDGTEKYVWISCFRVGGLGAHMVEYDTGNLVYSVTGLLQYAPDQYTYTAGLHGVGTIGQKGSYLALATSSCKSLSICIPTVPWHWPIPEKDWTTAPFIVIDLSTLDVKTNGNSPEIVV